jgi:hypothetical protein
MFSRAPTKKPNPLEQKRTAAILSRTAKQIKAKIRGAIGIEI